MTPPMSQLKTISTASVVCNYTVFESTECTFHHSQSRWFVKIIKCARVKSEFSGCSRFWWHISLFPSLRCSFSSAAEGFLPDLLTKIFRCFLWPPLFPFRLKTDPVLYFLLPNTELHIIVWNHGVETLTAYSSSGWSTGSLEGATGQPGIE